MLFQTNTVIDAYTHIITRRSFLKNAAITLAGLSLGPGLLQKLPLATADLRPPSNLQVVSTIQPSHHYEEHATILLAPERGFYKYFRVNRHGFQDYINLVDTDDLTWVRPANFTLVSARVSLEHYRSSDVATSFIERLQRGFNAVRESGVKVILRFVYNNGNNRGPDTRLDWMTRHISQLQAVLRDNADVIAVVQAGFIGAWGEWHSSTNGLDNAKARRIVLENLLQALPEERIVQIRAPQYKEELFGPPLDSTNAHNGSPSARIGHHNDCFLASANDLTYPLDKIDYYTNYLYQDTLFVPIGGETCRTHLPRTNCTTALTEFKKLHYSYLNDNYLQAVVDKWKADGCYTEIATKLGYRLVVRGASFNDSTSLGSTFPVSVSIENVGWAAPFNPRTLILTLESSRGDKFEAPLGPDARGLTPEKVTIMQGQFVIDNASFRSGQYDLYLSAPDSASRLHKRRDYALPFANKEYDLQSARMRLGSIRVE